ncbi:MAG: ABC transporter substrate-binding protein [Spirochaetales bacterium]|nr:ABC transporter substrate-binding protein [Spirochaetales bacterium]
MLSKIRIAPVKTLLLLFSSLVFLTLLPVYAEETVKIGIVFDLSGIIKDYSRDGILSAELAVEEINKNGGVLGRKVELIVRDGKNDPAEHFRLVDELAQRPDVAAVIGGGASPTTVRGSEAARLNRIPYLVSLGNAEYITVQHGHPYVFQFQPNSAMETHSWAIFLTLMPWNRYAWVGPDYDWGYGVYDTFIKSFEQIGVEIEMVSSQWHPLGTDDFTTIVDNILEAKPEMLLLGSYGEDVVLFYETAQERGLFDEIKVFGRFPETISEQVGTDIPEGIWVPARAPFKYLYNNHEEAKAFIEEFRRRSGSYPLLSTLSSYDALLAWAEAVRLAGTLDRESVADALRGITFQGLRGESYIRAIDGQMNSSTYFGMLNYDREFESSVLDNVIEVQAERVWLTPEEITALRSALDEE